MQKNRLLYIMKIHKSIISCFSVGSFFFGFCHVFLSDVSDSDGDLSIEPTCPAVIAGTFVMVNGIYGPGEYVYIVSPDHSRVNDVDIGSGISFFFNECTASSNGVSIVKAIVGATVVSTELYGHK